MRQLLSKLPHFWIIVIILDLFIVIYNANFIDISGWFPWSADVMQAQGVSLFVLTFIFLLPIVYASLIYGLRGAVLTWITFMAGTLPRTIAQLGTLEEWMGFAMFALVALLMGCLISLARSSYARQKALMRQIAPRRWNSVARIVKAQESERKRIARELHNDSLQDLLVVVNHMHAVESGKYGELPPKARAQVERVETEVLCVIDALRKMSHGLNVSVLDNTGLVPAVKWQAESIAQETGIKLVVTVKGKEHKLKSEAEIMIFRIAQEALSNIRQHAHARNAEVTLDFTAIPFRMTIRDDGCGFNVREDELGGEEDSELGLDIIRQRTKLLGGKLSIRSAPGKGTEIILETEI